jgi:hypothetical protein
LLGAAFTVLTVLSLHSAAFAQQPALAYQPYYPPPPAYAPPPGYPYRSYAPSYYQPPRPLYRPFTLALGLGAGELSFRDTAGRADEGGLSYTLRVGFGVSRDWLVFLGLEGIGTNHQSSAVWQTAYLMGAQCFVLDRLYLRGGFGLAKASAEDGVAQTGTGEAVLGAAGVEFAQGYTTSLAIEGALTVARYTDETWSHVGVNLVLSFY